MAIKIPNFSANKVDTPSERAKKERMRLILDDFHIMEKGGWARTEAYYYLAQKYGVSTTTIRTYLKDER